VSPPRAAPLPPSLGARHVGARKQVIRAPPPPQRAAAARGQPPRPAQAGGPRRVWRARPARHGHGEKATHKQRFQLPARHGTHGRVVRVGGAAGGHVRVATSDAAAVATRAPRVPRPPHQRVVFEQQVPLLHLVEELPAFNVPPLCEGQIPGRA